MKLFNVYSGEYDGGTDSILLGPQEMTEDQFFELCSKIEKDIRNKYKENNRYSSSYEVNKDIADCLVNEHGFTLPEWRTYYTIDDD